MEFKHETVMLDEVIQGLNIKSDGIYVDGTLGGGGHSEEICKKLDKSGLLIGIDKDKDALVASGKRLEKYSCRKIFIQSNYSEIKNVLKDLKLSGVDGAILDLGVSSFQLDNAQRGFSYMRNAPLDMRMNQDDHFTAYDVINGYSEKELSRVIAKYGEERWHSRIAEFIVKERKKEDIKTTEQLVNVIKAAIPAKARREGPHPAKRTFQAIRIEVNEELSRLKKAVGEFCEVLNEGGRFCVISFHSLEDRIVKETFNEKSNPCTCPKEFPICVCGKVAEIKKITRKPMTPSREELENNPRSRSSKLRIIERI